MMDGGIAEIRREPIVAVTLSYRLGPRRNLIEGFVPADFFKVAAFFAQRFADQIGILLDLGQGVHFHADESAAERIVLVAFSRDDFLIFAINLENDPAIGFAKRADAGLLGDVCMSLSHQPPPGVVPRGDRDAARKAQAELSRFERARRGFDRFRLNHKLKYSAIYLAILSSPASCYLTTLNNNWR